MKILVTGANGQLGSELKVLSLIYNKFNWVFTDINELDLTDFKNLNNNLSKISPNIIINCAAYTNVDKAESNEELANLLNYKTVDLLSKWSSANNCNLMHISTDYVFDGNSSIPLKENAITGPLNVYGLTKLKGEKSCLKNDPKCHNRLDYEKVFKGCGIKDCGTNSNINCVYYNINNCGYDFIETIDNPSNKIVIYILPTNLNTINKQTHKYLGNIADLDNDSKLMINELYKLYSNKKYNIFVHIINNTGFYCLHFHIIIKDNYKREKHFTEKGTYIIQDIFIEDIIKNININSNYYKNSNYSIIRQE